MARLSHHASPVYEQGYNALKMAESVITRNILSGAVESHYLYAYGPGNRRFLTFDAQTTERVLTLRDLSGTPLREFSVTDWGPNAAWRYTHDYVSGPEGLFARRAANGVRRYLHRDHLGSLRLLSSGSPFNAVETGEHHYYPFGTSAFSSGNDAPKSKYTGHERDTHGLADYMMGRTCAFTYQRFTSVDPGRDGWNLYAYVGNDPVNFNDPTGHERAQILLDQDVERFLAGEITRSQYHQNIRARGQGALFATSLFIPGPEDVFIGLAVAKLASRPFLGGARMLRRLLRGADKTADVVQITARTTRANGKGIRVIKSDGTVIDITEGRVKEFIVEPRARGGLRPVKFDDALPNSKGKKRVPTKEELELLEKYTRDL